MPTGIYQHKPQQGFQKGHKLIPWNKGKINVYNKKTINIMRDRKLGYKASIETRKKMSEQRKGNKTNLWRGGINKLSFMIRKSLESNMWRTEVFKRDDYTCQECGQRGCKLHAHHIKAFSIILQEFLNFYNQFSPIEDKETLSRLAITYKPFWELSNGKTLCENCHKNTDSYLKWRINGYKNDK